MHQRPESWRKCRGAFRNDAGSDRDRVLGTTAIPGVVFVAVLPVMALGNDAGTVTRSSRGLVVPRMDTPHIPAVHQRTTSCRSFMGPSPRNDASGVVGVGQGFPSAGKYQPTASADRKRSTRDA
jgi:hypothetical protein